MYNLHIKLLRQCLTVQVLCITKCVLDDRADLSLDCSMYISSEVHKSCDVNHAHFSVSNAIVSLTNF